MVQGILEVRITGEKIVHKYDRVAPVYDLFFGYVIESKARQRALELAGIENGERVLEVAMGTGLNFVDLLKRNPDGWVHGVDISLRMLEKAKKRILKTGQKNYGLHLGDCGYLPFEKDTFDVLINHYLFDILPVEEFVPILQEFKRVLKEEGRIVLVNMTKGEKWVHQLYEELYRLRLIPPLLAGCRGVFLQPFLEQLGFTGFKRELISKFGFPSEVIQAVRGRRDRGI